MKLSRPKVITFWIAVILAVLGVLASLAVCRREIFFSNENNVKLRAIISELQTR